MKTKTAVIALKAKGDKAGIKTLAYQVSQIVATTIDTDTQIIDCIITFGGVKDVLREVKKLDAQKRFDYLIIYSPAQIAQNALEYQQFMDVLESDFKIEVRCLRAG